MLDTRHLDAYGVGNYYVATEMELRAAIVSYKEWKKFLLSYNEEYMAELGKYQVFYKELAGQSTEVIDGLNEQIEPGPITEEKLKELENREFGVSVPRSVFNSEWNDDYALGDDGFPRSPCNPPYGYPLYYKRAEKLGIPEAGVISIVNAKTTLISNAADLQGEIDNNVDYFKMLEDDAHKEIQKIQNEIDAEKASYVKLFGTVAAGTAAFRNHPKI